jgi:sucrose-phosphate synthase
VWSGLFRDRAIFTDLDKSLLGDPKALRQFIEVITANRKRATFGIATGRRLKSALRVLRKHGIPQPDVLISSIGTDIYYFPNLTQDTHWRRHIAQLWNPRAVQRILVDLPGLKRQPLSEQGQFKISYFYDPALAPTPEEITSLLLKGEQTVNMSVSFGQFLDIVPARASKGAALRWFADKRDVPVERILAVGGSGADEDMMRGNTLAAVVANRHDEELSALTEIDRIFFAESEHAAGILEAMEHYDFFGACRPPES